LTSDREEAAIIIPAETETEAEAGIEAEAVAEAAATPESVAVKMETATQRLRDQAWKLNGVVRIPMTSEQESRSRSTSSRKPPAV
jgi:hypothetical protein